MLAVTAAAAPGRRAIKNPERVEIPFFFRSPRFDQLYFGQFVHWELYVTTPEFVNNPLSDSTSSAGELCCKENILKNLCQVNNLNQPVVDNAAARFYNSFKAFKRPEWHTHG